MLNYKYLSSTARNLEEGSESSEIYYQSTV